MDNITHSLAGALLGEAVHDLGPDRDVYKNRRLLLLTASIIANNFPDLDGVYTQIMPPPLGYLLHHRGHTHTILLLIPQLLIILAILWLVPRFRRQLKHKPTFKLTSIVITFGLMLHILFDSWNSYGIHPFYPFNNKWFYGDLVFIVEPFLWFAFAAPLFFIFHSKWTRFTLIGVIATVPLLAAYNGLLTWYSVAATFSFALITSFFAQRAKTVSRKILAGVTAAILFLATQSFTAMKVREQLNASFEPQSPKHKIIDPVLSALPANPFCWSVIQLEVDQANDKYITISKIVSSWPTLLAAESCPVFRAPAGRAEMELSEFVAITEKDCYVDAWLRFSRAPFFENSLASDLRFAQRQISNFSNLEISSDKRYCPRFIPPWSRPRQDILDAPIRGQAKTNP